MSTTTTTPLHTDPFPSTTPPSSGRRTLSPPRIIAATAAATVLVNLAIWAVGDLAGGSFEFTDGDRTSSAAPGGVVVMTAVPLIVGMTLAALLSMRWPAVIGVAKVAGPLAAILTIGGTLAADFDTSSTVALSLTHIAIVPFLLVGLEALRRRGASTMAG